MTRRPTPSQYRRRRVVALVVVCLLAVPVLSLGRALTGPGTDSLAARGAEWARGHGLGGLVSAGERLQYRLHPPPVGGGVAAGIPSQQPAAVAPPRLGMVRGLPAPPSLVAVAGVAPLPGEGQWQPVYDTPGGPALREAFVRADAAHTSQLTGVAWLDPRLVALTLHPGTIEPGGGPWPTPPDVPAGQRGGLVATFNSAFRLTDARGGFYDSGRTVRPLRAGAAALVLHSDGTATVGQWGRDVTMSPSVTAVRQNLDLVVDGGALVPGLDSNAGNRWGATLGNRLYVWRSGIGVTRDGALVYVAGPVLSVATLADTLRRAGAVRAMELDINREWTTFISYRPAPGTPAGVEPAKLLPAMSRSSTRYLTPDSRDFLAAVLR